MAEIVNLNKARKAKVRSDKKAKAVENRVRFGRTKSDRKLEAARTEKTERDLAAHKRGDPDE